MSTPPSLNRTLPAWRRGGAVLAGALWALPLPAADWQALVANNPFGAAAGAAAAPAANDQLEFRGVLQEDGIVLVNLYDPATKQAQWVPVDGPAGGGVTVTGYDESSGQLSLNKAGQPLTLALKQAKVSLLATPPPPPAATPGQAATAATPGDSPENRRAQFARNLPPEAQAMIEEIRRRRALRQQGQAPAPGQTVPGPGNRQRQQ